jgi:hypothetical protein
MIFASNWIKLGYSECVRPPRRAGRAGSLTEPSFAFHFILYNSSVNLNQCAGQRAEPRFLFTLVVCGAGSASLSNRAFSAIQSSYQLPHERDR